MKKIIPFVSIFIVLSSLFLFFAFRQTPKGNLWQGYSVLYVPTEIDDAQVTNALMQFGISDFTCLSNQYMPTTLSADSVEISLINLNTNALEYLSKRNNYFFDESQKYKLYYIPVEYSSKLSACVNYLNKNQIFSGVDSSTSYPILLPIAVFLFMIVLFVFAKNKLLFLSTSVPVILFALCFPHLSCAVSSILLLLVLFATSNLHNRRGAVKILLRNLILLILIFVSVLSSFATSVISGLMFSLLLLSTASLYILYDCSFKLRQTKYSFNPVLIRSAKLIPVFSNKEKIIFPSCLVLALIVFVVTVFSFDTFSISNSNISLPSSSAIVKAENLPELTDYAKWDFIVKSYPYKSINCEETDLLSPVSFYRYTTSDRNVIETMETLSFDSSFIQYSLNQIELLKFNAIEKVLKKQPANFLPGYSVSGSHHLSLFSIIFVIVQILCVSFLYIKTVIKKGRGNK